MNPVTNPKISLFISLQAPGPMAEVELWLGRASVLSFLRKQLEQPAVEKIVEILTEANVGIVHTLKETIDELSKYHFESDGNAQYLKLLERHFLVSNLKKPIFC